VKRQYLICVLMTMLGTTGIAQTRLDVGGQISGASQLGYTGPAYGAVGHVVTRRARFGFEAQGAFLHAAKVETGDGSQFNATAALRVYLGRVFVTGGFAAGHQSTSAWSKSGAGPLVGVGWDDGTTTVQASFDHQFDANAINRVTFQVERLARVSERTFVSIRPFVAVSSYGTPHAAVDRRQGGARAGVTVGVGRRF
jgi:hypothetical protein